MFRFYALLKDNFNNKVSMVLKNIYLLILEFFIGNNKQAFKETPYSRKKLNFGFVFADVTNGLGHPDFLYLVRVVKF